MTKQDVKDRLTVPDGVELVYSDACDLPVGVHDHRRMSLDRKHTSELQSLDPNE